ncbi:maleylacetoacetate isomerase [Rhodobacterales bacterium HKCCE3408]|nr:maleylacetoacetate isomerase [Rhodobacterales bacterium HKCCE3408]
MKLYTYWRSSSSYRVRIAMALKGQGYDSVPVHLVKGEQRSAEYGAVNPSNMVPTLELDDGTRLTQSLAIIDYLDATWPEPPLVPADPLLRARVLAASLIIAADTQPVTNSGVVSVLKGEFGVSDKGGIAWMVHWMEKGLAAFMASIRGDTAFCFGDAPGLADICLVPQLYNAHRWGVDMAPLSRLTEIEGRCLAHPAFAAAAPEVQPDANT